MVTASKQTNIVEPSLLGRCLGAGVAAAFSDATTHPLETVKVRLQIQGESRSPTGGKVDAIQLQNKLNKHQFVYRGMIQTIYSVSKQEGARSLYGGLLTSMQRQLLYASIRIGLYEPVKRFYVGLFGAEHSGSLQYLFNVSLRICAAVTCCCIGVTASQPLDVLKLRFQAMQSLPGKERRYRGIIHAYTSIWKHEGIHGMWKGTIPNCLRNSVCSASELVTYDVTKETLLKNNLLQDDLRCHFLSALCSGLVATITTCPVDVVRGRYMNSGPGVYKSSFECAKLMLREEGLTAFYKGVVPLYWRIGSWNLVMFLTYEQIQKQIVKCGYVAST